MNPADESSHWALPELSLAELREVQALKGVKDEILRALLPRVRLLYLAPDEGLLQGGEPNLWVYIVVSGLLRVELDEGGPPLAHIGPGETVGELSLLAGTLATANVSAERETRLLVLDEPTFWWLAEYSHEFSTGLLVRLAKRMRQNNESVRTNIALQRKYEQAALTDAMTGLRNRRWLNEFLPRFIHRHVHASLPLSVGIMDIDHFKRINDDLGHAAGDAALVAVAQVIGSSLRPTDFAARMGGEEFALIFPDTALAGALSAAERLREAVASAQVDYRGTALPRITVSIGLAALEQGADTHGLLVQADQALYRAKRSGRDRVSR